jgi:hypothetical protein
LCLIVTYYVNHDCRTRILAQIRLPETTRAILECLDFPTRTSPVADPAPEPGSEVDLFHDIEAGEFDMPA